MFVVAHDDVMFVAHDDVMFVAHTALSMARLKRKLDKNVGDVE